jgi:F-type H+-transporting ATPase subunit delta
MRNPRLATRYAKSILDLAIEQNSLEATLTDMRNMSHVCTISPEFEMMLQSPVIKGDKKLGVIFAVLASQELSVLTKGFITLLVNKGREQNLPEIAKAFITQYNLLKHIRTVKLTTAAPVSDAVKNSISAKVATFMPSDSMNLETAVDESLIGGFVLEVEDQLFDGSVKKYLNDVKSTIIDQSYVAKLY